MKLFNNTLALLILFSTIACSSTKIVKVEKFEKTPLISDHYLMMSLLNRPMTADQKLMLAFAKHQDDYLQEIAPVFVHAIMIKGDKEEQAIPQKNSSAYSTLIANDINAIRVSGPL